SKPVTNPALSTPAAASSATTIRCRRPIRGRRGGAGLRCLLRGRRGPWPPGGDPDPPGADPPPTGCDPPPPRCDPPPPGCGLAPPGRGLGPSAGGSESDGSTGPADGTEPPGVVEVPGAPYPGGDPAPHSGERAVIVRLRSHLRRRMARSTSLAAS